MAVDPLTPGLLFTQYRQGHIEAQERAKGVIDRVDEEFAQSSGDLMEALLGPGGWRNLQDCS